MISFAVVVRVRSLLSLFRPLTLPALVRMHPSLPIAARQLNLPPLRIDNHSQAQTTLSQNDPSAAMMQVSHNLSGRMP